MSDKFKYMVFGSLITAIGFLIGSITTNIDAQQDITRLGTVVINDLHVLGGIYVGADPKNPSIAISEVKHNTKTNGEILITGETGGLLFVQSRNAQSGYISLTVGDPTENPESLQKGVPVIAIDNVAGKIYKPNEKGEYLSVVWGGVWEDKE